MKKLIVCSLSLILALTLAGFILAAEKAAAKATKVSGKVTAIADNSLTLETKKAGKTETVNFKLTADTKKPENLAVGDEVTVEFKEEAGEKIATSITAKAKAAAKK